MSFFGLGLLFIIAGRGQQERRRLSRAGVVGEYSGGVVGTAVNPSVVLAVPQISQQRKLSFVLLNVQAVQIHEGLFMGLFMGGGG